VRIHSLRNGPATNRCSFSACSRSAESLRVLLFARCFPIRHSSSSSGRATVAPSITTWSHGPSTGSSRCARSSAGGSRSKGHSWSTTVRRSWSGISETTFGSNRSREIRRTGNFRSFYGTSRLFSMCRMFDRLRRGTGRGSWSRRDGFAVMERPDTDGTQGAHETALFIIPNARN
jgi:hypothetical protein